MTGNDLKQARKMIGRTLFGHALSLSQMANLCGLAPSNGADTMRKWEEGDGPSGPVAYLVQLYVLVTDRHCSQEFRDALATTIERRIRNNPTTLAR